MTVLFFYNGHPLTLTGFIWSSHEWFHLQQFSSIHCYEWPLIPPG